jgi:hypothetical protein
MTLVYEFLEGYLYVREEAKKKKKYTPRNQFSICVLRTNKFYGDSFWFWITAIQENGTNASRGRYMT